MFYLCPLTEIKMPKNVTTIGNYAFYQHKSMQTELRIPNGVTTIGNHAFTRNSGAPAVSGVKIYLPASLTSVSNDYTFEYCSSLAEVDLPDSLVSIGINAFSKCVKLTEIDIPDKVKTIAESAFSGASELTDVSIGKALLAF